MGARSTGSHPTTTKADGHLLEYFRSNMGSGGGGTNYVAPANITATGGTKTTLGGFIIHTFTSSGAFTVNSSPGSGSVDVMVVAGGGAGGSSSGPGSGGGGAGGMIRNSGFSIPAGPFAYPIVVGGAGAVSQFVDPSGPTTYEALAGGTGSVGDNTSSAGTGGSGGGGTGRNPSGGGAGGAATQPW